MKFFELIKILFSNKTSPLKESLKISGAINSSFYNFVVEKHIDWAIILGLIFCTLPYLGSKVIMFLFIKVLLFITMLILAYIYIKTWDSIKRVDEEKVKTLEQLKGNIDKDKILESIEIIKSATEITNKMVDELKKGEVKADNLQDYLNSDSELARELKEKLNEDKEKTASAFSTLSAVLIIILEMKNIPKAKLINYYRLLTVFWLTLLYFVIYAVEVSFYL